MTTKQQEEALNYFRKNAGKWRSMAEGAPRAEVNVIEQRNDFVLMVADECPEVRNFLDVGCGTGELVCDAAKLGIESVGVDYAQEMIDLSAAKAASEKADKAKFVCASIFDFKMEPGSYDLISANGFIEYISHEEMGAFFDLVAGALAPGGSFVVGSRNRLFNLVTMNAFTLKELEAGESALLIREAVAWTGAEGKMVDLGAAESAALEAAGIEHTLTGVEVTTRFQFTPFQLINLLQERGLEPVEVYPVHVHGVSPAFAKKEPGLHASIANLLQEHARGNNQLLAHASTFMLHVRKA